MKLAFACDHSGTELKSQLMEVARGMGHECVDYGIHEGEIPHYPIYAARAAKAVQSGVCDRGVVICGTGIGVSVVCNKFKGIVCSLCGDCFSAKLTRQHNDSNMLAIGARVTGSELAKMILEIWLTTEHEAGGRHTQRLEMLHRIENGEDLE